MLHFTHAGWFLNDGGRSVLCLTFNRSQAIFIHTDPARQRSRCQRCHRNHGNHSFLWHYLDGSVHDHATDDLRLVGLLPLPSLSVVDYCGHVGPRMCRAGFGNLSAERQRGSRQQAERRGSRLHLHTLFLSLLLLPCTHCVLSTLFKLQSETSFLRSLFGERAERGSAIQNNTATASFNPRH